MTVKLRLCAAVAVVKTVQEAEAFAPQLRAFERAVREYHRHVQGEALWDQ